MDVFLQFFVILAISLVQIFGFALNFWCPSGVTFKSGESLEPPTLSRFWLYRVRGSGSLHEPSRPRILIFARPMEKDIHIAFTADQFKVVRIHHLTFFSNTGCRLTLSCHGFLWKVWWKNVWFNHCDKFLLLYIFFLMCFVFSPWCLRIISLYGFNLASQDLLFSFYTTIMYRCVYLLLNFVKHTSKHPRILSCP